MKKPDSDVIDQIISVIEDRREMEQAVQELKEKANELVSCIVDEPNKKEAVAYLYWMLPEIRTKELSLALTGSPNIHNFLNVISSVTANINCERCNSLIEIKSRTQLNEEIKKLNSTRVRWAEGYKVLCKSCQDQIMELRKAESDQVEKERNNRLQALRYMPYKEYLRTPEWQARRKQHLKSAGYRCQVCNSPQKPLDVHHRTYARRGQEYFKDLIVLCRACHHTFHENGKVSSH